MSEQGHCPHGPDAAMCCIHCTSARIAELEAEARSVAEFYLPRLTAARALADAASKVERSTRSNHPAAWDRAEQHVVGASLAEMNRALAAFREADKG